MSIVYRLMAVRSAANGMSGRPISRETSMRVAIVGFPYSGKTAVYRAVTGLSREQIRPAEESGAVKI